MIRTLYRGIRKTLSVKSKKNGKRVKLQSYSLTISNKKKMSTVHRRQQNDPHQKKLSFLYLAFYALYFKYMCLK